MPVVDANEHQPTLLETVLRLQGDFRRVLEPIGVTPLQGGVIMFLCGEPDSQLIDVANALSVQSATLGDVVRGLVRRGWVTKQNSEIAAGKDAVRLSSRNPCSGSGHAWHTAAAGWASVQHI